MCTPLCYSDPSSLCDPATNFNHSACSTSLLPLLLLQAPSTPITRPSCAPCIHNTQQRSLAFNLLQQSHTHLHNPCCCPLPAGSINAEYKAKLRSLAFNLRDDTNPELRQAVVTSKISPGALVRMSAGDLANKDLAAWRRKVEEEHNKAIELDVDTAAKVGEGVKV